MSLSLSKTSVHGNTWVHNETAELVAINTCDDDGCLVISMSIQGAIPYQVRMGGHAETLEGLAKLLGKEVVITVSITPAEVLDA